SSLSNMEFPQTIQAAGAQIVAVPNKKWTIPKLRDILDCSCGSQQLSLDGISKPNTPGLAVAKVISHTVGQVMKIDDEIGYSELFQPLNIVLEYRTASNRHHALGDVLSQRLQARPLASRKQHRL